MVLVILSASVERCFVSRMRDFSSFCQVPHDIYMLFVSYFDGLHDLQGIYVIFSRLFLTCMFKDQNLAEHL